MKWCTGVAYTTRESYLGILQEPLVETCHGGSIYTVEASHCYKSWLLFFGDLVYHTPLSRCQNGIKHGRVLLGKAPVWEKNGKGQESSVRQQSKSDPKPGKEREKEVGGSIINYISIRRTFCLAVGESLSPSRPSVEVSQEPACLSIPAALGHLQGAAHGKCGLSANVAIDFWAQHLGP